MVAWLQTQLVLFVCLYMRMIVAEESFVKILRGLGWLDSCIVCPREDLNERCVD